MFGYGLGFLTFADRGGSPILPKLEEAVRRASAKDSSHKASDRVLVESNEATPGDGG